LGDEVAASAHGLWAELVLAMEAGELDEATTFAAALAHSNPASPIDWFNYGVCLRLAGKTLEAALAFESVVRMQPDDSGALVELAAALWTCGQMDKAGEAYEALLFKEPGNQQARRALLMLALERGDLERVMDLRDGVNDPTGDIAYGMGVLQHRAGQLDHATMQYLESLSRQPERADCQWNLAHALFELKRVPEAKMHWRKALELKPELALSVMR
jgi:tetratricopeptide (TPR) repeat protein